MALDIRQLRYVVEVADRGNFSRAAERLGIAQPALSQQVLKVERELGVELFHRHPRGAAVTPAGEAFVEDARAAVAAFDGALDRAGRRARGETGQLTLGFTAGAALWLTPLILTAFGERYPSVDVRLRETDFRDPSGGLDGGEADVALVRLPLSTAGLWHEALIEEPRVLAVSASHALARRSAVSVAEILDVPLVGSDAADEKTASYWLLDEHRGGRPAPVAAWADSYEAELQIVATGRAASVTCGTVARGYDGLGIVFVPITDISPSQIVVAYRAGNAAPPVRTFVQVATEVRDAQSRLAHGDRAAAADGRRSLSGDSGR